MTGPAPTESPLGNERPRKSPMRWVYRAVGAFVVLIVLLVLLLPTILSSDLVVGKVRDAVRDASDGLAEFDTLELGWGSFDLRGLRVRNPDAPGMPKEDALALSSASGSFSLWSLIFSGKIAVTMHAQAPVLRVYRNRDGQTNLQEIQKRLNSGSSSSITSESTGPKREPGPDAPEAGPAPLQLDLRVDAGRIELTDAALGVKRRIEDLTLHVGNQAAGTELHVKLRGRIVEEDTEDGTFTLTTDVPLTGRPPERVDFSTTGIDLDKWSPLVNGFLEQPFEQLTGVVRGDLSAQLQRGGAAWRVTGNLTIAGPAFVGGPMGAARGVRGATWSLHPQFLFDSETRDTSLEGTRLDLGFVRVLGLSPAAARESLPKDAIEPGKRLVPIGLRVEVDLAKLAEQPGLLPDGVWKGRMEQNIAVLLDPSTEPGELTNVPFHVHTQLRELGVPAALLPEGARTPSEARFDLVGAVDVKQASLLPTQATLASDGVGLDSKFAFDAKKQVSGDVEMKLDPGGAGWFSSMLPKGLQLTGSSVLTAKLGGGLAEDGPPLTVTGAFSASTVRYLGNELSGFSQEFRWTRGGELSTSAPAPARLNGGPFAMSLSLDVGKKPTAGFKLQWNGGKSAYGLTPALRYALPLLAGLPTENVEKLAGIDFTAMTNLTLQASGALPGTGQKITDVLDSWIGSGQLQLTNGGFTPSTQLAQLLRFQGTGSGGRLDFDAVQGAIRIDGGRLHVDGLQIGGKDGKVEIRGSTSLLGDLTHSIDFTGWLAQHRDGKRILAALGDQRVTADLRGSLLDPKLKVEDFAKKVLEGGVQNAVKGLLEGIQGGKKPEDALKDLLDGLGGKKKKN